MRSNAIIFVCSISAGFWMILAGCKPYEPGTSMPILVDYSPFASSFSAAEAEGEVNWSAAASKEEGVQRRGDAEAREAVNPSGAGVSKEAGASSGINGTLEVVSPAEAAEAVEAIRRSEVSGMEEEFDLSGAEGMEGAVDWNGIPEAAAGWNRPGTRANACTKSYAALELHRYLCLVSGLNPVDTTFFPLRNLERIPHGEAVVLGTVAELERFPDILELIRKKDLRSRIRESGSFALIPDGKKLFIIGYDRTGILYGAYHWLESLGIRWFEPGKQGEFIPEKSRVRLPRGISVQSPAFKTRGFWAWEDRGSRDFYVWMARNRLNFWTIAEKNRAFLQKIGIGLTVGGHLHFDRFLNPGSPYPFNHAHHSGDENRPPDPYRVSTGEYRGDEDGSGQLSYFEAHPEWYGLVGGKRKTFSGDYGTNICTSNEDAVTELSRKLVDELADGEWKDAGSLNFWPIDSGTWCECRTCSVLGTPTDRMLLLVHQVRRALRKAHEDGRLGRDIPVIFPIYNETMAPPSRPLPPDFDFNGCIGTFFPIQRCYSHNLDDPSCTEYNKPVWDQFLGWSEREPLFYKGPLFIGEYYNVSAIKSLPVLYMKIMAHDIPLYYAHGVRHAHYMHVYTGIPGMKRLNNYLFARLLWNPDANVNALKKDYFEKVYGPGATDMARLYDRLEFAMSGVKQWKHTDPLTSRISQDKDTLFHREHLRLKAYHPRENDGVDLEESVQAVRECWSIMDRIMEKGRTGKAVLLKEDNRNLRYAESTINLYYYTVLSVLASRAGESEKAREYYRLSLPYARTLKEETGIVRTASSHANASDGLEASRIQGAWYRLGEKLGLEEEFQGLKEPSERDE